MIIAKLAIAVVVYGALWLLTTWMQWRGLVAAYPQFPGRRRRLFKAVALMWSPWLVGMLAGWAAREYFDPNDQMSMWASVGMAISCALGAIAAAALAIYAFPGTRRLQRDLIEARRALKVRPV